MICARFYFFVVNTDSRRCEIEPQRIKKDAADATEQPSPLKQPTTASRPLLDKTPFPNRTIPSQSLMTPAPLHKLVSSANPDSHFRPSSARTTLRAPRSACKSPGHVDIFKTPATNGKPWDGDVSIGFAGDVAMQDEQIEEEQEEDGDIEYMPPTAICERTIRSSFLPI
jgi:hypothetical protein